MAGTRLFTGADPGPVGNVRGRLVHPPGPWEVAMSFNLATILRESAKAAPGKPLLYFGDRAFSYAEVDELSGRVAASLWRLGLVPGQKVAVHLPNVPQF